MPVEPGWDPFGVFHLIKRARADAHACIRRAMWRTPKSASSTPSSAPRTTWRWGGSRGGFCGCTLRVQRSQWAGCLWCGLKRAPAPPVAALPLPAPRTAGPLQHGQSVPPVRRVWQGHPEVSSIVVALRCPTRQGMSTTTRLWAHGRCTEERNAIRLVMRPLAPFHCKQLRQRAVHRCLPLALPAQ